MTRLNLRVRVARGYARSACKAIALTPVLLVVGVLGSFVGEGGGPGLGGVVVGAVCLAAPTAAIVFAVAAMRAGEPSGRKAFYVSVPLFVVTAALLPVIAISLVAWLIALGAALGVLGLFWVRATR